MSKDRKKKISLDYEAFEPWSFSASVKCPYCGEDVELIESDYIGRTLHATCDWCEKKFDVEVNEP